jgi:hypothetical protein
MSTQRNGWKNGEREQGAGDGLLALHAVAWLEVDL